MSFADGLSNGSHRNRGIGNSVYPPILTLIGQAIRTARSMRSAQTDAPE